MPDPPRTVVVEAEVSSEFGALLDIYILVSQLSDHFDSMRNYSFIPHYSAAKFDQTNAEKPV